MKKIVEFKEQNCYIPLPGMCFIKCFTCFTNKDYMEGFRNLFRNEKYGSKIMISARTQPFCWKYDIYIDCFDGMGIDLRNITRGNTSLYIYNNQFCLIWKSNGISFNQAIEEVKLNFEVVDKYISDKHVKGLFN